MHPLKRFRIAEKKTQQEVAIAIGCGRTTYISWETCKRYPRPDNINQIVAATGGAVTAEDLHKAWAGREQEAAE